MGGPKRRLEPIEGIHDLVALRLPVLSNALGVRRRAALQTSDHLLRRFGQADMLHLDPGATLDIPDRSLVDEIWVLVDGEVKFEWEDRRADSPTQGGRARLSAKEPTAVLTPFGVAFHVTAGSESAILLRLASHGDDEVSAGEVFSIGPRPS